MVTPTIYLDGKKVQLTAYNIAGSTYYKLRDIAKVINFNVVWDGATKSIDMDTSNVYKEDTK
ncbi:hypothetical protein D3C76_807930 [compost metagenome]